MATTFGDDPVAIEVARVLESLRDDAWDGSETRYVDLKEEAGRRDASGAVLPTQSRNDRAVEQIAAESACMANSPQGGALIIGVTNDGELIGTSLDVEWLRHRAYELTDRKLTLVVREEVIRGHRLLVITAPQAIEPIRWRGRVHWRVDDHCVEVDPATWHDRRMMRMHYDWSAQPSYVPATQARESAVEVARALLRATGEPGARDLADQSTPELLRRLNAVTGDGLLTNAGALVFHGREEPCLDYIRRDVAGGDSRQRVRQGGIALIEELSQVFVQVEANNATTHRHVGMVAGQHRALPEQAVREAIVNGVAHREWSLGAPTVIEHVGNVLRVTSPGGFFGGVTAQNIITHPSQSRNRALAELLSSLRVAEREGVGVDRMVREMIRLGHSAPDIQEIDGPHVRVSLVGDNVDESWMNWLAGLSPRELIEDLNALLLLKLVVVSGWFDVSSAEPVLQLNRAETVGAIKRMESATVHTAPVLTRVPGVPDGEDPAWALAPRARQQLQARDVQELKARPWPSREMVAREYARHRGRISSTELGGLVGASPSNVGAVLKRLEDDGVVRPSRTNRRGAGFYYLPT